MLSTIGLSSTRRSFTSFGMVLSGAAVVSAFAAGLALQNNVANLDPLIKPFQHVICGQRGNADGYERFHLHSGFGCGYYFGCDGDAIFAQAHLDINVGERESVAHGD